MLKLKQVLFKQIYEAGHSVEYHEIDDNESFEHFAPPPIALVITVKLEHQHISEGGTLVWTHRSRLN